MYIAQKSCIKEYGIFQLQRWRRNTRYLTLQSTEYAGRWKYQLCLLGIWQKSQGKSSNPASSLPSPGNAVGMTAAIMSVDAAHKYEEEKKQKEEHRKLYNEEVVKTNELQKQADDCEIVCKIRAMMVTAERKGTVDTEWITWAKAKAELV